MNRDFPGSPVVKIKGPSYILGQGAKISHATEGKQKNWTQSSLLIQNVYGVMDMVSGTGQAVENITWPCSYD